MAIERPSSWTAIANEALLILGHEPIANIDTDTSENGTRCRRLIGSAVRNVLVEHDWRAGAKRADLGSPLADTPVSGYSYAYSLPADCVRPIEADAGGSPYKIEQLQLLTDASDDVFLVYVRWPEAPTEFPDNLRMAFGIELAWLLGPALAKSEATIDRIDKMRASLKRTAVSEDGKRKATETAAQSLGHTWGDENR